MGCDALNGAMVVSEKSASFEELTRTVPGARAAGDFSAQITGVAYDSRLVVPGDVFVAVAGFQADGHDFAEDALTRGAAALVVERKIEGVSPEAPQFVTASCREALSRIGDAFYGHPSGELALIGVTGTNGKTTTAFLIDAILRSSGRRTGLMGTIHYRVGGEVFEEPRTTSEGPDLQRYLRRMADAGRFPRRDGSVEPRTGPGQIVRLRVSGGGIQQSHAGPSRFSWRHGVLLSGETEAVQRVFVARTLHRQRR